MNNLHDFHMELQESLLEYAFISAISFHISTLGESFKVIMYHGAKLPFVTQIIVN